MRRQKRDTSDRAYKRGYHAGLSGKSKSQCPTETPVAKQQWLTGWRDGRIDNWDGMIGVSGIHKIPGIST